MDRIDITDFYPKYPYISEDDNIDNTIDDIYSTESSQNFFKNIFSKKEFNENKLGKYQEQIKRGELFKQQINISRFISGNTPYNGILIFHEMGVGKTCAAVATVEKILENKRSNIDHVLVITKSDILINNFRKEIAEKCTYNKYNVDWSDYEIRTERKEKGRLKKELSRLYSFETYEKFIKKIQRNRASMSRKYNHSAIIIDEVHNIKKGSKSNVYEEIKDFLDNIEHKKVILLSGTPMKDQISEIGDIFNLILPPYKQFLNFQEDFTLLDRDNNIRYINPDKTKEFKNIIKGMSSYLSMRTSIKKTFNGNELKGIDFTFNKIKSHSMKFNGIQNKSYLETKEGNITDLLNIETELDDDEKMSGSFHQNSINSSLAVFPDGTFGSDGYKKYISKKYSEDKTGIIDETKGKEISKYIRKNGTTQDEMLKQLKKISIKYHYIIKSIINNPNKVTFIYCGHHVTQSGAIYLTKLIEIILGYTLINPRNKNAIKNMKKSDGKKRCILLTGYSSQHNIDYINISNRSDNLYGDFVHVIIGTEVISEGISLKNVQYIHIVEPWWNFSETDQAISRAIRATSHNDLIENNEEFRENRNVNIYLHAAIPSISKEETIYDESIDIIMYIRSSLKDRVIKNIERLIKESSFDCGLNYERNFNLINNSRECDYLDCNYECDGLGRPICDDESCRYELSQKDVDFSTFDIFYNENYKKELEKQIIEDLKQIYTVFFDINTIIKKYIDKNYSIYQILSCLNNIILSYTKVRNNYGIKGYLNNFNNNLYISDEIISENSKLLYIYNKYPVLSMKPPDFETFLNINLQIDQDEGEGAGEGAGEGEGEGEGDIIMQDTQDRINILLNLMFTRDFYIVKGQNSKGQTFINLRDISDNFKNFGQSLLKHPTTCQIIGLNKTSKVSLGSNLNNMKPSDLSIYGRSLGIDMTKPVYKSKQSKIDAIIDKLKGSVFIENSIDEHKTLRFEIINKIERIFLQDVLKNNKPLDNMIRLNQTLQNPKYKDKCKHTDKTGGKKQKPDLIINHDENVISEFKIWLDNNVNYKQNLLNNLIIDENNNVINNKDFDKYVLDTFFNTLSVEMLQ